MMRSALPFAAAYLGISFFLGLIWVVSSYPNIPTSAGGWLWLFVLVLPLQIAGEGVGELLWHNKASRFVAERTAARRFSLVRITYALALVLMGLGLVLAAAWAWRFVRPLVGIA